MDLEYPSPIALPPYAASFFATGRRTRAHRAPAATRSPCDPIALSSGLAAASLAFAGSARAHELAAAGGDSAWLGPLLAGCMAAALILYGAGLLRMWRHAGTARGIRLIEVTAFAFGWIALAAAVLGPLELLARRNFALHMLQHELLMVVAAPLLVLGRPLGAWSWTFPLGGRRRIGRLLKAAWWSAAWRFITAPLCAWMLHAIALWAWHVPAFFRAATSDELLHAVQHASFLASALLFWWAVLGKAATRPGPALLMLFTTMVHTGALGALLVFSPRSWYGPIDALADQQLGGLIMWIPGGTVYLLAALAVGYRLLLPERRTQEVKAARAAPSSSLS